MMRILGMGLVCLLLGPTVHAGEVNLAGNWKVTIFEQGQAISFWILKIENKDGMLAGSAISLKKVPPSSVTRLEQKGDLLHVGIRINNGPSFNLEAKVPAAGAKKLFGSLANGPNMIPILLEATNAKNQFELDKETIERNPSDPRVFGAAAELIKNAKSEKTPAQDVQVLVETVLQSAEKYGPRWQGDVSMRLLESLASDFPDLAVNIGRKMEAGLDPSTPALVQLQLLNVLGTALKKSGKEAAAKQMETRIDKLENLAYVEHVKSTRDFPIEKVSGRKTNRAVVMELFTGSQCPPCVAADLAFDAVEKTFKHSDVILLQYHLHVPGPDPLTNPDSEARQEYYGSAIRGTPTILFNGKVGAPGGGGRDNAPEKYKEYVKTLTQHLEKDNEITMKASAVRKGDAIEIKASAAGIEKPSEKLRLRLALVEDWVRYKSPNGLFYHHRVVRALPGGVKGTAITKASGEASATVDVAELQGKLRQYLDEYARNSDTFPDSQRPLRLRNLHVVALVQDDATSEILQAVDVPVTDE